MADPKDRVRVGAGEVAEALSKGRPDISTIGDPYAIPEDPVEKRKFIDEFILGRRESTLAASKPGKAISAGDQEQIRSTPYSKEELEQATEAYRKERLANRDWLGEFNKRVGQIPVGTPPPAPGEWAPLAQPRSTGGVEGPSPASLTPKGEFDYRENTLTASLRDYLDAPDRQKRLAERRFDNRSGELGANRSPEDKPTASFWDLQEMVDTLPSEEELKYAWSPSKPVPQEAPIPTSFTRASINEYPTADMIPKDVRFLAADRDTAIDRYESVMKLLNLRQQLEQTRTIEKKTAKSSTSESRNQNGKIVEYDPNDRAKALKKNPAQMAIDTDGNEVIFTYGTEKEWEKARSLQRVHDSLRMLGDELKKKKSYSPDDKASINRIVMLARGTINSAIEQGAATDKEAEDFNTWLQPGIIFEGGEKNLPAAAAHFKERARNAMHSLGARRTGVYAGKPVPPAPLGDLHG